MNKILSWHDYFLSIAKICAFRSKDPNTKVGCCIVDENNHIVSTGYNGLPIGLNDKKYPWNIRNSKNSFDTKYPYVIHAEVNAILFAKRDLTNAILYTTLFPCSSCTKIIIQSGIKTIYYIDNKYENSDDNIAAKKMFKDSLTKLIKLEDVKLILDTFPNK